MTAPPAKKAEKPRKENIFKRLRRFLREVIAELRKVIWPNRKQMVTYTTVVLVFVAFMVAYISGLDLAFIKGVTWLFG
ncbi:preprotein translocase subunit SecE [Rhodococcus triatomae BKS 15-14]|nr:preprotein translocase subunit SecE [Rhodococcus triatomae BKS 15-14]